MKKNTFSKCGYYPGETVYLSDKTEWNLCPCTQDTNKQLQVKTGYD